MFIIISSSIQVIGLGYYATDLFLDLFSNVGINAFITIGVFLSLITYPLLKKTFLLKCGLSIVMLFYVIMFYYYKQSNMLFFINPFGVFILLVSMQIIIIPSCILTQQIKLIGIDFTSNQLSNLINYRRTINTECEEDKDKSRVTMIEEVPRIKEIPHLTFKEKMINFKYFCLRRRPPSLLAQLYRN